MRCGWVKAVAIASAALALGACHKDASNAVDLAERARAAEFFMSSNARAEGVQSLPSGLQYKIVTSGPPGSPSPDSNDLVRVDYEGTLTDGTVFDSSFQKGQPYVTAPDQVVPGWTEALQRMHVGDEWLLFVPPALGYGEQASGEIPPNSVLVFRIKLLDMAPVPGGGRGVGVAQG